MTHGRTVGVALRSGRRWSRWAGGVLVGLIGPTFPMPAQETPYGATSPLRLCCAPTVGWTSAQDTVPGLLRMARLMAAHDALPATWRRYGVQSWRQAGAWRQPQDAAATQELLVVADGGQAAGRWRLWGQATFGRQHEEDVRWRNQSAPSLSSVYVWADSVGGTFRSDRLGLAAAVVSPAWRGITLALPVDYGLGQGARRNDPRPLYRRRVAELSPSLRWQVGAHQFGVGAVAGWHREDLEIGGGISGDVPVVFRLRGIATFDRTQLISAERAVLGGVVGAQGGYAWQSSRWVVATGVTLRLERDSVRDGTAAPVNGGQTQRARGDWRMAVRRHRARGGAELAVLAQQERARGRDPVFAAVNATNAGQRVQVTTAWWEGGTRPLASWTWSVDAAWHTLERRDVAAETRWRATRWPVTVRGGHRWQQANQGWLLDVGVSHDAVTSAFRDALRTTRLTPILTDAEYAVGGAPTYGGQVMVAWDRVRNNALASRVSLSGTARQTTGMLFDGRRALSAHRITLMVEFY